LSPCERPVPACGENHSGTWTTRASRQARCRATARTCAGS